MASVWVPFTSESKEAVADYDEIRKEMRLALQECGRKLGIYLRRRSRMKKEAERRSIFERYIGEIAAACETVTGTEATEIYEALKKQASRKTAEADNQLDEDGQVVSKSSRLDDDEQVIIVKEAIVDAEDENAPEHLFGDRKANLSRARKATATKKKTRRKRS